MDQEESSVKTLLKAVAIFLSRFTLRGFLWSAFLKSFRGFSFKDQPNIFLSAIFDILFYSISGWAYNTKMLFSGIYEVKPYNILVYERGGTDDLYNVLPRREDDVHDIIVNDLKVRRRFC
jgi:hypothetical protein